ncbi:hypothetical protein CVT25_007390 [Psilocybe cyanescens]|uniref:F-box domain-containing protein n=1 Tax=Psilocybe cyanescens TaxID=93625 RepID=A0A409XJB8_PSICY|nr:hypothetical protein CVT25_007390 [Psilocybe cyanescens]
MPKTTSEIRPRRLLEQSMVAQEIADCEQEMLALEKAMIDLKYKRMSLDTKMNTVSDPMAMLPLDVTTEIFAIVNDSQDRTDFSSLPALFLLGRICKTWRNIVWNRPFLWKDIAIRLSYNKYAKQERLLEEWLNRSGACQLYYNIASHRHWEPPESFATLILKTASRWKSFKCISPLTSLFDEIASHTFPALSTIELDFGNWNNDFNINAPRLRKIQILSHWPVLEIYDNWQQLTKVSLKLPIDHVLNLIQHLDQVQALFLESTGLTEVTSLQPIVPKELLHLSHLKITGRNKWASRILTAVTVPALSNLELHFTKMPATNTLWMDGVENLLRRSSFSLATLNLQNINLKEELGLDFLKSFVTLSSLSLRHQSHGLSDLTINRLNPNANGRSTECLLPALTHLDYSGRINFKAKTLTTMLEQRLAVSQTNPLIKALRVVDITYLNASWAQTGDLANPNRVQAFYRDISDLASHGTVLKVMWDENSRL